MVAEVDVECGLKRGRLQNGDGWGRIATKQKKVT
jgi:hypothetical protein